MSSNKQSDFIKFENSNTNDNQASQIAGRSMGSVNMVIAENSPGTIDIDDQNQLRHAVQHGSFQLSTSEDPSVYQAVGPTRSDMPSSTINENVISQPSQFVPQYGMSSISRGYNKVTGPGVTLGEPEDSSLINSQTNQGIREIDIDVEVGGFVSNMSYSSNVRFPNIAGGAPTQGVVEILSPKALRPQVVASPSSKREASEQVIIENIAQQPFLPQITKSRNREYSQSMHHPLQILQNMKVEKNRNMLDQIDRSKFGTAVRQSEAYQAMRRSTNPEYLDEGDVVNFSSDNKYEMKKDISIQRITGRHFNEGTIDSKRYTKKMKSVMIHEGQSHDYTTAQESGTRRKRAIKFEPEMYLSLNGLKNNPWSKKKNKVESYANLEVQSSTRSIVNRGVMKSVELMSRQPSIAIVNQDLETANQKYSLKSLTSAGSPSNWNLMSAATGGQKSDTNHSLYVGEEEILDDLRRIALKKMMKVNSLRNKKPSKTIEPGSRKAKLTLAEQERLNKEHAEKISMEEQLQKLDLRFPKMKEFHEYEAELLQIQQATYDDARANAQKVVDQASVINHFHETQNMSNLPTPKGVNDDRYYKLYVPKSKKMPITEEAAYENENDESESQYTRKSGNSYNLKISSASKSQTKSQFGQNPQKKAGGRKFGLSKPHTISLNSIASNVSSPSPDNSNSVSRSSSRHKQKPQLKRQVSKVNKFNKMGAAAKSNMNIFGVTSPLKAGTSDRGRLGGLVPTKKMTQVVNLDYQASELDDQQMEEVEVRGMRALQRIKDSKFEPNNMVVTKTGKRVQKATKYDNRELLERYEQYKRETQQQLRVYDNFRKKIIQSTGKKRQTSEEKANFLVKQILLEKYLNSDELNGKYNLKKEIVDLANMESGLVELFDYKPPLRGKPAEPANMKSPVKEFKAASVNEYIGFLTHGKLTNQVVFEFARQLKSNLGTDLVSKFNMKSLNLIDSLVQNVIQRVKFKDMISGTSYDDGLSKQVNEVVEQQNLQTTQKTYADKNVDLSNFNPVLLSQQQFISQARNQKTLALPIIQKIYLKNLTLVDYQLSKGHCQAMKEAFKSNPKMINTLFIDQSTSSEEHNRLLLEGLSHLEKLYSLTIKNTELGHESIEYISEIIRKPFPNALLELRIVNCKLSLTFQEHLFGYLSRGTSLLNNLALINAGFTQETVKMLCSYLDKHNSYLRHLDISCNELLSPHFYRPILRLLAGFQAECDEEDGGSHSHLALESINLSTNSIFDAVKNKLYMEKHPSKDEEDTSNNYELEVIELLSLTFQSNQTLTHFDLSNCGLSELIIYEILTFIKSSPTLASIHLSNNPGIGASSMAKFASILDCQVDEKKEYNIHFEEMNLKKDYEPEGQYDQILSAANREQIQARRICKDKQVQLSVNEGQYKQRPMAREAHSNPTFLLQRKLGHDREFTYKASSWRLNINSDRDCWVCDRHIFSLLFWNPQIGDLMNINLKNEKEIMLFIKRQNNKVNQKRQEQKMARQQELLEMKRSGRYNQVVVCDEIERPVLYSSNNNWEARDLLTLSEYCFLIDSRKTKRMKKLRYVDIKDYENAGSQQKSRDNFDKDLYDLLHFYVAGPSTYRQILHKNLDYRDPQFINTSTLCLHSITDKARNPTTFVLPQFLQAGRYSYVIEYKGKQYFHRGVIHYRQEAVPVRIAEASKGTDEKDAFNYKNSIFSDWREDIQARLSDCLQHDLKYTRLDTFVKFSGGPDATKQQDLYNIQEGLQGLIQQNFVALKYAYIIALSQSNQIQGIDLDSMSLYVTKICRIHNNVNADNLKDAFQATVENFQGGPDNNKRDHFKDSRFLCRKEFIELFIRIGMIEFPDLKATESFEKILQHIHRANEASDSWQDFRDDQLWTEECHNIFEANRHELHAVFLKYSQRQSTQAVKNPKKKEQQVIGWNQMRKIFMQDSVPAVSNDIALVLKASVLSKCTVPTDFEKGGQAMKMQQFEFVEFLEIIARVADLKTRGTHQENQFLHKKIELVLSQILLINGDTKIKRQLPNLRITYQSTSELEDSMRDNLGKSLEDLFKRKKTQLLAKSQGSSIEGSIQNSRGSVDTDANQILENESVIKEAGVDEEEEFGDLANKNKIKLEIHSRTEESINVTDGD